jgi:hypothetical protein
MLRAPVVVSQTPPVELRPQTRNLWSRVQVRCERGLFSLTVARSADGRFMPKHVTSVWWKIRTWVVQCSSVVLTAAWGDLNMPAFRRLGVTPSSEYWDTGCNMSVPWRWETQPVCLWNVDVLKSPDAAFRPTELYWVLSPWELQDWYVSCYLAEVVVVVVVVVRANFILHPFCWATQWHVY